MHIYILYAAGARAPLAGAQGRAGPRDAAGTRRALQDYPLHQHRRKFRHHSRRARRARLWFAPVDILKSQLYSHFI